MILRVIVRFTIRVCRWPPAFLQSFETPNELVEELVQRLFPLGHRSDAAVECENQEY